MPNLMSKYISNQHPYVLGSFIKSNVGRGSNFGVWGTFYLTLISNT